MHTITILDRQRQREYTAQVPSDRYILEVLEEQGIALPFACRQGACTTCAVRIKAGQMEQSEAIGIGAELKSAGYGLICIGRAQSSLVIETQDEDEVKVMTTKEVRELVNAGLTGNYVEDTNAVTYDQQIFGNEVIFHSCLHG